MTKYAALIRGIGPGDPQKTNEKLRSVFIDLGFSNVQSVISSGNLIFETKEISTQKLESTIEEAWPKLLGFKATTVVRSQSELQQLIDSDPFNGTVHSEQSYLLMTFLKQPTKLNFKLPFHPPGKPYKVINYANGVLCTITDTTVKTSDLMTWLEKQFGDAITSRTPITIQRILKKMSS